MPLTRNLAEVMAGFRAFIDALPARLEAEFDCAVRPATVSEGGRLVEAICFCDACDEDSDPLIEQTNQYVDAATLGCREFRQAYANPHDEILQDGRWLQHGFELPDGGGERSAGADIRGELFSWQWAA